MTTRNTNVQSFLRLAMDINQNLSQIIHLSNNLRYNTYHLLNRDTTILANDIFFPPVNSVPRQIESPPPRSRTFSRTITRPRRTFSRSRRVLPRNSGTSLSNEVFRFAGGATPDEIGRATDATVYADISTNQLMCPITQQNFLPDDNILRIRHCGHVFTANRLRQWFRSHYDCPVCRYDIRPTVSPAIETMLRDIASQTLNTTDLSNNSTTYEYSVFTSNFP
jgi:hypothetical protein